MNLHVSLSSGRLLHQTTRRKLENFHSQLVCRDPLEMEWSDLLCWFVYRRECYSKQYFCGWNDANVSHRAANESSWSCRRILPFQCIDVRQFQQTNKATSLSHSRLTVSSQGMNRPRFSLTGRRKATWCLRHPWFEDGVTFPRCLNCTMICESVNGSLSEISFISEFCGKNVLHPIGIRDNTFIKNDK